MKEVKVLSGQSLLDVAIQESGAVEAAFDMALLNEISITGALVAGCVLLVSGVAGKLTVDRYRAKRLKPATYTDREVLLTGIGYMVVEDNFIIA